MVCDSGSAAQELWDTRAAITAAKLVLVVWNVAVCCFGTAAAAEEVHFIATAMAAAANGTVNANRTISCMGAAVQRAFPAVFCAWEQDRDALRKNIEMIISYFDIFSTQSLNFCCLV